MGAYINGDYKSEYSGDQIDAAIGKVRTPDSTPTASSDNLVTSGGVKAALDQKQAVINDLSTIRQGASDGTAALTATSEIEQVMAQGYKYYGVATPNTNPGTLEQKVFYIASQPGTYTNLGGIVVNDGEVCTLMWNETSWSKQVTGAATAAQVSQLGQDIGEYQVPLMPGYYDFKEVGNTISFDVLANINYRCALIPCQPGDIFHMSGTNVVSTTRTPYEFVDANGVVIARYYGGAVTNGYVKAPSGAAYFAFVATATTAMLYYYPKDGAMAQAINATIVGMNYECTSAASAIKELSPVGFQAAPFVAGTRIMVKFTNQNTKVSGVTFDGKPLYYNGLPVTDRNTWQAGDILELFFDGSIWYAKDGIRGGGAGGGELPSGGHDGDVLRTDGRDPYWGAVPTRVVTDESQILGVLVDQYEDLNVGLSSVNSIKRAVEVAGVGGTIVFTPNKTYLIDDTIHLLDNQIILGNGATLKRMNESTTTIAVAVEESSDNTIQVSSVPGDWKVGDRLFLYDSAQGQLGTYIAYADIASISGNVVTVTAKSVNPWTLPVGTKVTKSVPMLVGEQAPIPVGFKVYNLIFDGNKEHNSGLLNWYIHGTILSFGYNTEIRGCKFLNIPTENISTQGAMIVNNYAQDLNGSFVHLSCPSENMLNGDERYMGTFVIGNMCKRVCSVDNDILRHSQAPVTYSWNAGKLIVIGNQFYGAGNSMCFQANMEIPTEPESPAEVSSNSYMIYTGNIFSNFKKIGEWAGGTAYIYPNQNKRMFTSNMFKDCGTNDMRSLYTKTNIMFEMNKLEGNTSINTDGNTLMYRIDTEISTQPTASALTTKYGNLPEGGLVYIVQLQKQYRKILVNNSITWVEETIQLLN